MYPYHVQGPGRDFSNGPVLARSLSQFFFIFLNLSLFFSISWSKVGSMVRSLVVFQGHVRANIRSIMAFKMSEKWGNILDRDHDRVMLGVGYGFLAVFLGVVLQFQKKCNFFLSLL